jgi:glutamate-1-semialdehyde aminotransferase/spore coat polysaccharide biosynthesis protein SpsF (cytidylyltransferase family)
MKAVLIGIARMGSTRLPGKVLMPLGQGRVVLDWILRAADEAQLVDEFVVATTVEHRDNEIAQWCAEHHVPCYRGSEDDVLSRFYKAAEAHHADVTVRVTCDCPFIDPQIIDQVIALHETTDADYASNIDPPTWPDGMDCEVISIGALQRAAEQVTNKIDRECVSTYIQRNRFLYRCETLVCPLPAMHKERWVLDTESDYQLCQAIAAEVPHGGWLNIKRFLDKNPEVRRLNAHHQRNERYFAALAKEPIEPRTYHTSRRLLRRAEETIPLGAQTFSKSQIQYPADSPLFVTHGNGGYCFDVDGNRYVDLVGGLLPVILGHNDPDVDYAIRRQLNCGISHSLSTDREAQLSEKLCEIIPCAEMTRFGKNGTDITTAAVRLARCYTGRDLVLSSGYHGWADWTVAWDETRSRGVPLGVVAQTVPFTYGDERVLNMLKDEKFACVVVEPETDPDYLKVLRSACNVTGTVLVFDEIITWPRWGLSGAQGAFGVIPDLTCISKAMANGMPIGALVGRRDIMKKMTEISFSGTFFGETLSLAAAIATIEKLENTTALEDIAMQVRALRTLVGVLIDKHNLTSCLKLDSSPLLRMIFASQDIKTLFIQEMAKAGTLIIHSHNLSAAHGGTEMKRVLISHDHAFGTIREALDHGDIEQRISGQAIPEYANVRNVRAAS